MSGRNRITLRAAVALATSLAGATVAGEMAWAQEAIMLETIGAVRMASPEEARPVIAARDDARPQASEAPRREAREASAR